MFWLVTGQHADGRGWVKCFWKREHVQASIQLSYQGVAYTLDQLVNDPDTMLFMLTLDDRTCLISSTRHEIYKNPEHL